jgi:hypothetical protein
VTGEMVFFGYNAAGPLTPCPLLRIGQRGRRGDTVRSFRCALCQHGARLHRHRKSPAVSDPARSPAAWSARCAASRLTPGSPRKALMSAS